MSVTWSTTAARFAVVACTLALSGCLLPEKFSASVEVRPDRSYTYAYEGTAIHLLAAQAIKQQGSLTAKQDSDLRAEVDKGRKDPAVKKLSYEGAGRYAIAVQQEVRAGQQPTSLKILYVKTDKDGVTSISVPPISPKDSEGLRQLGIKVDGKLEVRLPAGATVVSHNASGTPGLLSKAYTWKIGNVDERPSISFRVGN